MRKIDIMKSLKIKNKKIKIEKLNESEFDDWKGIVAPTMKAVKNVAMTAVQLGKGTLKLVLSPITYIILSEYNQSPMSFEGYIKNVTKSLSELDKDITAITKNYDNDFKAMLNDIGATEDEMRFIMFAGSPPLAIANLIDDIVLKNRSRDSNAAGLNNITNILDKAKFLLAMFITGENPQADETTSDLRGSLNTQFDKYIKTTFSSATHTVLNNLHKEEKWQIHSAEVKASLSEVTNKLKIADIIEKPVSELDRVQKIISKKIMKDAIETLKLHCDKNVDKTLKAGHVKKLSLKTKLITEDSGRVVNEKEAILIAFSLALIYFVNNQDNIVKVILSIKGEGGDKLKQTILDCIAGKKNLVIHLMNIYANVVAANFILSLGSKVINDNEYDIGANVESQYDTVIEEYCKDLPQDQQKFVEKALKQKKALMTKNCKKITDKTDIKNKVKFIKNWLNDYIKIDSLPIFSYDSYSMGLTKLGKNFLTTDDIKLLKIVNEKAGNHKIKNDIVNMVKQLDDQLP
jgi:hypothetical protein